MQGGRHGGRHGHHPPPPHFAKHHHRPSFTGPPPGGAAGVAAAGGTAPPGQRGSFTATAGGGMSPPGHRSSFTGTKQQQQQPPPPPPPQQQKRTTFAEQHQPSAAQAHRQRPSFTAALQVQQQQQQLYAQYHQQRASANHGQQGQARIMQGAIVWIPDDTEVYIPALAGQPFLPGDHDVIFQKLSPAVSTESVSQSITAEVRLSSQETASARLMHPQHLESLDDMVLFHELSEEALLHNLRQRFLAGRNPTDGAGAHHHARGGGVGMRGGTDPVIYTNIGNILIALNPFYTITDLYSEDIMQDHIDCSSDLPPHVYSVADRAYRAMRGTGTPQAILISGESGAGKTETTKHVLRYLVELSESTDPSLGAPTPRSKRGELSIGGNARAHVLENRILQTNPLMESFGNAKTAHNDNSSRFGKLLDLSFDDKGIITRAVLTNYLLEKSRVAGAAPGERNYHIFYQAIAGRAHDPTLCTSLAADQDCYDYHFLTSSDVVTVEGVDDIQQLMNTKQALQTLLPEFEKNVMQVIAAVLNIGNINFVQRESAFPGHDEHERLELADPGVMAHVCELIGVPTDALATAMSCRRLADPHKSQINVPYTVEAAADVRDALAKALYARLFDWLVVKVNECLRVGDEGADGAGPPAPGGPGAGGVSAGGTASSNLVVILDIFGFESFEMNSFEQLCINYCNEKLQYFFNRHIFETELQLYRQEGIDASLYSTHVEYQDNAQILQLIEMRNGGVFALLDEELALPKGNDRSLLDKLTQRHSQHPNFHEVRVARDCFEVVHYAGAVRYNVVGMMDKNRDELVPDVFNMVAHSRDAFISHLFNQANDGPGGDGSSTSRSSRGSAHGMLAGRRSEDGGPTVGRKVQQSLSSQFKSQLGHLVGRLHSASPHFIRCIKSNRTKRAGHFHSPLVLRQMRYSGVLEVCHVRQEGYSVRLTYEQFMARYGIINSRATRPRDIIYYAESMRWMEPGDCVAGRTLVFGKSQLEMEAARAHSMRHRGIVILGCLRGLFCRRRFRRQRTILQDLEQATHDENLVAMEQLLVQRHLLPSGGGHLRQVQGAMEMLERHAEERDFASDLSQAMTDRDRTRLSTLVASASKKWKYQLPDSLHEGIQSAKALIEQLGKEDGVLQAVHRAMAERDMHAMEVALRRARDADVTHPDLEQAKYTLRVLRRLHEAMENNNEKAIKVAMERARAVGIGDDLPEMRVAMLASKALAALSRLDSAGMEECINEFQSESFPHDVSHRLHEVIERMRGVGHAMHTLESSAETMEAMGVREAISTCLALGIPEDARIIVYGRETLARLEHMQGAREQLLAALLKHDATTVDVLRDAVEHAVMAGLTEETCPEVAQAANLINNREEQEKCRGALRRMALAADVSTPDLQQAVDWARSLGLPEDDSAMRVARSRLSQLLREADLLDALTQACDSCDLEALHDSIEAAKTASIPEEALVIATAVHSVLDACENGDLDDVENAISIAELAGVPSDSVSMIRAKKVADLLVREAKVVTDLRAIYEVAKRLGNKPARVSSSKNAMGGSATTRAAQAAETVVEAERVAQETAAEFYRAQQAQEDTTELAQVAAEAEATARAAREAAEGLVNAEPEAAREIALPTYSDMTLRLELLRERLNKTLAVAHEMSMEEEPEVIRRSRDAKRLLDKKEHALRSLSQAVMHWDRELLRVATKSCRDLKLYTEDLQQGERLLQALNELEKHCEQGMDADAIWTALARVQLISPRDSNGAAVEERVRALLSKIEVQDVYRTQLREACDQYRDLVGSGSEVQEAVKIMQELMDTCEEYGLRHRCDEWTDAVALLQRLKGCLLVATELKHYVASRSLRELEAAYRRAQTLDLTPEMCEHMGPAMLTLERLRQEQEVSNRLANTLRSLNLWEWEAILQEATDCDVSISDLQLNVAKASMERIVRRVELQCMADEGRQEEDPDLIQEALRTMDREDLLVIADTPDEPTKPAANAVQPADLDLEAVDEEDMDDEMDEAARKRLRKRRRARAIARTKAESKSSSRSESGGVFGASSGLIKPQARKGGADDGVEDAAASSANLSAKPGGLARAFSNSSASAGGASGNSLSTTALSRATSDSAAAGARHAAPVPVRRLDAAAMGQDLENFSGVWPWYERTLASLHKLRTGLLAEQEHMPTGASAGRTSAQSIGGGSVSTEASKDIEQKFVIPGFGELVAKRWGVPGVRAGCSLSRPHDGTTLRYREVLTRKPSPDGEGDRGDAGGGAARDDGTRSDTRQLEQRWYTSGKIHALVDGLINVQQLPPKRSSWCLLCQILKMPEMSVFYNQRTGYSTVNDEVDVEYIERRQQAHQTRAQHLHKTRQRAASIAKQMETLHSNAVQLHHCHRLPAGIPIYHNPRFASAQGVGADDGTVSPSRMSAAMRASVASMEAKAFQNRVGSPAPNAHGTPGSGGTPNGAAGTPSSVVTGATPKAPTPRGPVTSTDGVASTKRAVPEGNNDLFSPIAAADGESQQQMEQAFAPVESGVVSMHGDPTSYRRASFLMMDHELAVAHEAYAKDSSSADAGARAGLYGRGATASPRNQSPRVSSAMRSQSPRVSSAMQNTWRPIRPCPSMLGPSRLKDLGPERVPSSIMRLLNMPLDSLQRVAEARQAVAPAPAAAPASSTTGTKSAAAPSSSSPRATTAASSNGRAGVEGSASTTATTAASPQMRKVSSPRAVGSGSSRPRSRETAFSMITSSNGLAVFPIHQDSDLDEVALRENKERRAQNREEEIARMRHRRQKRNEESQARLALISPKKKNLGPATQSALRAGAEGASGEDSDAAKAAVTRREGAAASRRNRHEVPAALTEFSKMLGDDDDAEGNDIDSLTKAIMSSLDTATSPAESKPGAKGVSAPSVPTADSESKGNPVAPGKAELPSPLRSTGPRTAMAAAAAARQSHLKRTQTMDEDEDTDTAAKVKRGLQGLSLSTAAMLKVRAGRRIQKMRDRRTALDAIGREDGKDGEDGDDGRSGPIAVTDEMVSELPPGWDVRVSKRQKSGRVYYVHLATGKMQWTHPALQLPREVRDGTASARSPSTPGGGSDGGMSPAAATGGNTPPTRTPGATRDGPGSGGRRQPRAR